MRTGFESRNQFASDGTTQPILPNKSTLLKARSRNGRPSRRYRACISSAFRSAKFTLDGHSGVHPLQERQLLSAASNSAERNGSCPLTRSSSEARIMLARPRVDMTSSWVAMNVGHMMPVLVRQPPHPLHCSRLPMNERSLKAYASTGSNGSSSGRVKFSRRYLSILHRFIHGGKKDQAEAFLTRQRRNFEFGGENSCEGSFAAREDVCEISRRTQKPFDAVTGPAFYQARRPALDHFRASCTNKILDSGTLGSERFMHGSDFFDAAIGHHGLERKNMIGGCAVNRTTRAGGIVRDHSAKCRS